ncbi:MAG: glycosyltransferase family 39 protein [Phycisphaerae bacterium]|nr:glycosyltransferase family 39 protein [Phycisphaerae bacterium]
MIETGHTKKSDALLIIACLAFAVIVSYWSLLGEPLDDHECLVSVTAREMLQTGDWLLPKFDGQVRLQKTPLCYWLVASVAKVTGKVDEFSARLPSACFAVLSVAAILYFVSQWLGIEIAILSAAVWISSLAFLKYSHSARPEMALCSLVTISMLSFYSGLLTQSKRHRISYMLLFWISFALAMLAKGPAPLALIIPPIFLYFAAFRQWRKIKITLPIIGTILFLLIVLPWPIMAVEKISGSLAFWKREFIDRFAGDYASGRKPFWYYLMVVFLFAAPFSAFVPYTVAAPFYSVWEKKRPAMWYLWLWFIVQIAVMTISGGKRQHYILSAFPAFSILVGICLYDMIFELKAFKQKQIKSLLVGHIIAAVAGTAGLLYWVFTREKSLLWPSIHMAMMIFIVLGLVIFLFQQNCRVAAIVFFFAGYCAIVMITFVYFTGPLDFNNPSRIFSSEIGRIVPPDKELIAYNYVSARMVHYAGRNIPEIYDLNDVRNRYEEGAWIIATGDNYQDMIKACPPQVGRGFEIVFYRQNAERHLSNDTEGALFHKTSGK